MKKILALTSALILSMSCFVGCGDKKDSSDSGSSKGNASSSSKSDLKKAAEGMSKAFNAASADMDAEGEDCSGIHTSDSEDQLSKEAGGYYKDLNKYEWVCVINGTSVSKLYVADDWDSDVIGTYPEDIDTEGKKLSDFKN